MYSIGREAVFTVSEQQIKGGTRAVWSCLHNQKPAENEAERQILYNIDLDGLAP